MANPKDRDFVLQYMMDADKSDGVEFSDCCSIESDEEFSGDDVGDGSDQESEPVDEIQYNCDAERDLSILEEHNEITIQSSLPKESNLMGNTGDICDEDGDSEHHDNASQAKKSLAASSNVQIEDCDSVQAIPSPVFTDTLTVSHVCEMVQTPVTATGIDKLALTPEIRSGNSFSLSTVEKRKRSAVPLSTGLSAADIDLVRADLRLKRKPTTALSVIEHFGIQFDEAEDRRKAMKVLSRQIARQKEESRDRKSDTVDSSNDIVFTFSDFGVSNSEEVAKIITPSKGLSTPQRSKSKLFTPALHSSMQTDTPCRPSHKSGRKEMAWGSIKDDSVRKRTNNCAKRTSSMLSEFCESSEGRVSKLQLFQMTAKYFLGDGFEVRENPKKVKPSKVLGLQVVNRMSRRKMDHLRSFMKDNYSVSMTSRKDIQDEKKNLSLSLAGWMDWKYSGKYSGGV